MFRAYILLLLPIVVAPVGFAGQNSTPVSRPSAPAVTANNRFVLTFPSSGKSGSTAANQQIAEALASKLTAKGFVRDQTLQAHCCTLQIETTDATGGISAKITVMDLDKQDLYHKDYQGQGTNAAQQIADHALADSELMKALTGK